MNRIVYIVILLLTGSAGVIGQTPYDSFAPEAWRPMLGDDAMLSIDLRNESVSNSAVEFVVVDISTQQVLFINSSNQVLAVMQVEEDDVKWLSVDPLADKYPSSSPYLYCSGNPIVRIDSDGRTDYYDLDGNHIYNDGIDDRRVFQQSEQGDVYLDGHETPFTYVGEVDRISMDYNAKMCSQTSRKSKGVLTVSQFVGDNIPQSIPISPIVPLNVNVIGNPDCYQANPLILGRP